MLQFFNSRKTSFFFYFYRANVDPVRATKLDTTKASSTDLSLNKATHEFVIYPEYQSRYSHKFCKNLSSLEYLSLSAYPLNGLINEQLPINVAPKPPLASHIQRIDHTDQHSPISIALEHDAFDVTYGLVRNIMYTGKVYLLYTQRLQFLLHWRLHMVWQIFLN